MNVEICFKSKEGLVELSIPRQLELNICDFKGESVDSIGTQDMFARVKYLIS